MPEDTMLQQAIGAIREGDYVRARDLLTRLLKTNATNPEYWLWMSTVVASTRERIYCLQEALRLDPHSSAARRGLVLIGALPAEEGGIGAAGLLRRNWGVRLPSESQVDKMGGKLPLVRLFLWSIGGVVAIGLLLIGLFGPRPAPAPTTYIRPTPPVAQPSATLLPTKTLVVRTAVPTFVGPTPLWMLLEVTYTPTPFYGKTPHPLSEAYITGVRRFERGAWADVITFMQQVVVAEPDAVDAYYYMGEAYRQQGQYDQAIEQYDQALKVNMRYAPAYLGRARAKFALDPQANVDDDLNQAIKLDPNFGEAYLQQAIVAFQRGDSLAALKSLAVAEPLLPDSPLVFLYEARTNLVEGHIDEALNEARKANQLDATLLDSYLVLGQAYLAAGQPGESLAPLNKYLIYAPESPQVLLLVGKAYLTLSNLPNAVQAFTQALAADNRLQEGFLLRGEVYLLQDQANEALADFDAALKLNSKYFEANLDKGRALLALQRNREAYLLLDRTRSLAKTDAQIAALFYWRAQSLEAIGDLTAAAKDWEALLALPPEALTEGWEKTAVEHLAFKLTPTP
ncbi:MAG: tetratricopeptide repeat protein [Anaerolineaceae bacterium]|nr:tetratricopeptide repeat protein [Anaerolineaceae bacterium]